MIRKSILFTRITLLAWLIVLLTISVIPIPEVKESDMPVDKIAHFILYGITAILFFRAFKDKFSIKNSTSLSIFLSSLYGLTLEIIQHFIPYRSFELADILMNISGASVFAGMNYLFTSKNL